MDGVLNLMWAMARLMTQIAVMLSRLVIEVATWGVRQLSDYLARRAEAQRTAPKPAPRPMAAPRPRAPSDAELVTGPVPSAKEPVNPSRTKAESYARMNAPFFSRKYDMLWRAGQRDRVPQELWPHMGKASQDKAIFAMLMSHKLKTGLDYPQA
jgi:hypothetical protein